MGWNLLKLKVLTDANIIVKISALQSQKSTENTNKDWEGLGDWNEKLEETLFQSII